MSALGRTEEVLQLIDTHLPLPRGAAARRTVARELRANGHPDAAAQVITDLIEWYESRSDDEKATEEYRSGYASTLTLSDRWEETGPIFEELSAEYPDNIVYLGRLGIYAARSGDHDRARSIIAQLAEIDRPFTLGAPTVWQACIHSWLGNKEEAVRLIRVAHDEGRQHGVGWHRSENVEPLWDHPGFLEFLRPKG